MKGRVGMRGGVASLIGEEGSVAYEHRENQSEQSEKRRQQISDGRQVEEGLMRLREEVSALYASDPERAKTSPNGARRELEIQARERMADLPLRTRDAAVLAESLRLNDACLALSGTYAADIQHFRDTLAQLDGDLYAFVARLKTVREASAPLKAMLEQ